MNTTTALRVFTAAILFAGLAYGNTGCAAGAAATPEDMPPTPEPAPMCAPRSGTYSAHYAERAGGTCGLMADTTFGIDPNLPDVADTCTGRAIYTPDKCDETFDLTCPTGAVGGGTLRNIGWTEWTPDASSGKSTFDYIYADANGHVTCSSTYDISYVRL